MRRWTAWAMAGVLASGLAAGLALAQKPPPAGAPEPPRSAKPGPAPAPAPGGKPPPLAEAPPAQPAPPPAPPAPPPAPRAEVPPPPPADEPAVVARLRRLLGPGTALTYRNAEVTDPARGSVRLAGVSITPSGGRPMRMDSLVLDDLRDDGLGEAEARNLELRDGETTLRVSVARIAGLTVRAPAAGQPQRPDLVTLDTLRLEGVVVDQGQEGSFRLTEAALQDYGPGRQTAITLNGMELRLKPGEAVERVTLRRAALRGADLARIATALAADQPPPTTGRMVVEVEEIAASAGGRPVGSLAAFRLSSDQPETGMGSGTLALRALRLEAAGALADGMRRLGYPFLQFDLTADSRYDPQGGRLELGSISLSGRDMATLAIASVLEGASASAMQRQDMSGLRLVSAGLRLIDQGLLGKLLASQARETRQSEQQLRAQWSAMAATMLASPGLAQLREAVQKLIGGQARELALTLAPAEPLRLDEFSTLADPEAAARRLGLSAVAR